MSVHKIAELYWTQYFASTSRLRAERLRVDRGDLQNAFRIVEAALQSDDDSDEVIAEIISTLEQHYPQARDDGLGFLAAGPIEERWNSGDTKILDRLLARGIAQSTLAQIESGIWKSDPGPRKLRAKPRHEKHNR